VGTRITADGNEGETFTMENVINSLFPYLSWQINGLSASIWVAVIHGIFITLTWILARLLSKIKKSLRDVIEYFSEDKIEKNNYLKTHWNLYLRHFIYIDENTKKTEDFAESYFNQSLLRNFINLRFWHHIPGMFVGLGILGTFAGLTFGLSDFHTNSSQEIQESIRVLLGGINTAFLTSLHGIALSLAFGLIEKYVFHSFDKIIQDLCNVLNANYKLTKQDEIKLRQKEQDESFQKWEKTFVQHHLKIQQTVVIEFKNLLEKTKEDRDEIFQKWEKLFTVYQSEIQKTIATELSNATSYVTKELHFLFVTKDDEGNDFIPANIFRDLLSESEKQSQALQAFSVDLADAINAAINNIMTKEMTPVFERISQTLINLEEAIKSFSASTGKDIGNELNKAVGSLKDELKRIVEEFRGAFSAGAMQQLNAVVKSLDESALIMGELPDTLEQMTKEIKEMNDTEAKNRQQKIAEEFENTIGKFRESVNSIIENLGKAENKQIEREQSLLDTINKELEKAITHIKEMTSVQESSKNALIELLSETHAVVQKEEELLEQINENNKSMLTVTERFKYISEIMEKNFIQIGNASEKLQQLGGLFQEDFKKFSKLNDQAFTNIKNSLDENQKLLNDYVQKFSIIRNGLEEIFAQVDKGLKAYSQTTKQGINDYLSEFSNQLSQAAGKLAGSIDGLNELFEDVSDLLEKYRR
jgi:DNA repair exonuclease SbcCD ATPase subunit